MFSSAHSSSSLPLSPTILPSTPSALTGSVGALAAHSDGGPVYGSVASTLDLVDNRTLAGATQPATQDLPETITYDPANGELYVRGNSGESITVVNGSTDTAVAEVEVQEYQNPEGLTGSQSIAPVGGSLYVANEGPSASLSIINATTNEVTGSINLPGSPDAVIYDPANGDLYVPIWTLGEVVVLNATTHHVQSTVPAGKEPYAILLDPTDKQVFVANWESGNVSVINTTGNTVLANIATGSYPVALAWDSHDDVVDVANSYDGGKGTITMIQAPATPSTTGTTVGVGMDPQALAYAPIQDTLFVANGGSFNVSVINQTEGKVVSNPAAGSAPAAVVYDPSNHDVYVLNSESPSYNLTIYAAATDHVVGNVSINNYYAYGLAVDTANGNIFAVSEGSFLEAGPPPHAEANVTVVNALTNRAIASVPVIVYPEGLTYDPHLGDLLVADPGGNDTYLVNTTSFQFVGTRPVGLLPERTAFDSLNDEVYALDYNETGSLIGEVTVLNPNLVAIKNITTYYGPAGIAFDSANGKFYVSDNEGGNITVLNGTTNKFNTTISVAPSANLASVLYDPHNQDIYVSDFGTNQVIVVNGTKDAVVGAVRVGTEPESLAFDPRNDTIFVANSGSGNVSVISDSSNTVVATMSLGYPGALAYDSANNILYDAESFGGRVDVFNASTYISAGASLSLGSTDYPHGIVYDPANQFVYVSTEYNGSISVIPPVTYPVTFIESGLPPSTDWSVTVGGELNTSSGSSVGFSEPNGLYDFSIGPVAGFTANVTGGSVRVTGGSVTVDIGFTSPTNSYAVTFIESGLPPSALWNVTLNGLQNHSTTASIGFTEAPGTWAFSVGSFTGYVANNSTGEVSVSSAPVKVYIGFSGLSSTFPVTFIETGLGNPAVTNWSVTFYGGTNNSRSSSIGFRAPDGKWPFTVGSLGPGWSDVTVNVTAGNVTVAGAAQNVYIGFTLPATKFSYPVNFTESGLPPSLSDSWGVDLNGSSAGGESTLTFHELNGSYPFTVEPVPAGYSANPDSGSVVVAGAPYQRTITFTFGETPLAAQLTVLPSDITLGQSTNLTTTTTGGAPPFTYAYTGLPPGCQSSSTSSFRCTPNATGTFTVQVTVTDSHGNTTTAAATLTVASANGSGGSSSSWWEWILIAVAIAVALVVVIAVWRRRHRALPPPGMGTATIPPPKN